MSRFGAALIWFWDLMEDQFDQEWSSWHMWLAGHNGSGSLSVDQRPFVHLQSNRQARQACVTCLHKSLMKKQGKTKRSDATFNIGRNWIVLSTSESWYELVREDINRKKTFSFGHCPNHLNPPPWPQFGQLGPFFRKSKFKIWKSV